MSARYVSVNGSADTTGGSSNVFKKIDFNTVVFKDASSTYDTTNKRWTPGVDDYYLISAGAYYASSSTYEDLAIYVNGTEVHRVEVNPLNVTSSFISAVIHLDADDYVEWFGRTSGGWGIKGGAGFEILSFAHAVQMGVWLSFPPIPLRGNLQQLGGNFQG